QTGKAPGQFLTFKNGLDTLVRQLEKELSDVISFNREVEQITPMEGKYTIQFTYGENITADVFLMTKPHQVLPIVFPTYDFLKSLFDVLTTSVATVTFAFDQSTIEKVLVSTGFVVSKNSS